MLRIITATLSSHLIINNDVCRQQPCNLVCRVVLSCHHSRSQSRLNLHSAGLLLQLQIDSASLPIMRHRLTALALLPRVTTFPSARCAPLFTRSSPIVSVRQSLSLQLRCLTDKRRSDVEKYGDYSNSNARPVAELNENITQEEKDHFAQKLREDKGKQIRTPWHRQGSDTPPVARQRSAGAMTKGMFLSFSTGTRLLT
jgi:hypothetical protein